MTRTQTPVLIQPHDVRLYNRCPRCDRGPGLLCEGIEGVDLLTETHPERAAVRDWPAPEAPAIRRVDRYTVMVDGYSVRAGEETEARLRAMDDEQRARFLRVMGLDRG